MCHHPFSKGNRRYLPHKKDLLLGPTRFLCTQDLRDLVAINKVFLSPLGTHKGFLGQWTQGHLTKRYINTLLLQSTGRYINCIRATLYRACEYFVAENYDLTTAYAQLCRYPYNSDEKRRQDLIEHRKIKNAPPRRLWDLHANRVVPYWVAIKFPWAMSHPWVDEKDVKRVMTPINGYEWPVPIPKDADLDLIRIEMPNLGAEYV
ncbi:hypothetical protein ARMGADRAFT_1087911 [Armillaria gallica]|uniref:Uncharacterized protein n=1 Tax=Armillaria gallica TaxID=47427 RepID=A0A2H3D9P8_ARMGA|nr:hypothetical protein ARMGADRAFT_1087911 [Armillaria gallica]